MKFDVNIQIMPLPALLDPAGKTVASNLNKVSKAAIESLRIGKHIKLILDSENTTTAQKEVEEVCEKFLCNKTVETYHFDIQIIE